MMNSVQQEHVSDIELVPVSEDTVTCMRIQPTGTPNYAYTQRIHVCRIEPGSVVHVVNEQESWVRKAVPLQHDRCVIHVGNEQDSRVRGAVPLQHGRNMVRAVDEQES